MDLKHNVIKELQCTVIDCANSPIQVCSISSTGRMYLKLTVTVVIFSGNK